MLHYVSAVSLIFVKGTKDTFTEYVTTKYKK